MDETQGAAVMVADDECDLRGQPVVQMITDGSAQIDALIATIRRDDINAVDRAQALIRLRVALGLSSWEAVGDLVGFTRQHIHNLLSVVRLPEPIRDDIRAGNLTEKQARALRRLHDPERQMELYQRIRGHRLSGRAADRLARTMVAAGHAADASHSLVGHPQRRVPDLITALMASDPDELRDSRARLLQLQRWLDRLLERGA